MPVWRASHTSAMPPVASFFTSWYLPKDCADKGAGTVARPARVGKVSPAARRAFLAVVAALYAVVSYPAGAQETAESKGPPPTTLSVQPRGDFLSLEWHDAEDRVSG